MDSIYEVPLVGMKLALTKPSSSVSEIACAEVGRGMVLWDATSMPLEMRVFVLFKFSVAAFGYTVT